MGYIHTYLGIQLGECNLVAIMLKGVYLLHPQYDNKIWLFIIYLSIYKYKITHNHTRGVCLSSLSLWLLGLKIPQVNNHFPSRVPHRAVVAGLDYIHPQPYVRLKTRYMEITFIYHNKISFEVGQIFSLRGVSPACFSKSGEELL